MSLCHRALKGYVRSWSGKCQRGVWHSERPSCQRSKRLCPPHNGICPAGGRHCRSRRQLSPHRADNQKSVWMATVRCFHGEAQFPHGHCALRDWGTRRRRDGRAAGGRGRPGRRHAGAAVIPSHRSQPRGARTRADVGEHPREERRRLSKGLRVRTAQRLAHPRSRPDAAQHWFFCLPPPHVRNRCSRGPPGPRHLRAAGALPAVGPGRLLLVTGMPWGCARKPAQHDSCAGIRTLLLVVLQVSCPMG